MLRSNYKTKKTSEYLNRKMSRPNPRIQALYFSLGYVLTSFIGIRVSSSCVTDTVTLCLRHDLDGYVVSSLHFLWSKPDRDTALDCAADCYRDLSCRAFFYNNLTLACQGHSNSSLSIADAVPEAGWVHYRTCLEQDCTDAPSSGIFSVAQYDGLGSIQVFCDMQTDGGGWLVFQRRTDGSVDFARSWDEFKAGFGFQDGEFWLGNDYVHRLTSQGSYTLRIDLADFENGTCSSNYTQFHIDSEVDLYRITVGGYSGDCGDSLTGANSSYFTTDDSDNDSHGQNCAVLYPGGWWFRGCHASHLNGQYNNVNYASGVCWKTWKGYYYSLKFSEMKIRPS